MAGSEKWESLGLLGAGRTFYYKNRNTYMYNFKKTLK